MKNIILIWLMATSTFLHAQEPISFSKFQVSINPGLSNTVIRDRIISDRLYKGNLSAVQIQLTRNTNKFQRIFTFRYAGGTINNHNVDANVQQISLTWEYRNKIKEFDFMRKPAIWYLGPSPSFWLYNRKQTIAEPSSFLYGIKALINISLVTGLHSHLTDKLSYDISAFTNVLTYAFTVEVNDGNTEGVSKFTSPFSDQYFGADTSIQYSIFNWLDTGFVYQFRYVNHDRLTIGTDYFLFQLRLNF